MEYTNNTRPLLQESDSDTESVDLRTQSYQECIVIKDTKPLFRPAEPRDKYYMAYLIFYLLGMTTLLPWNFFITADDVNVFTLNNFIIFIKFINVVLYF